VGHIIVCVSFSCSAMEANDNVEDPRPESLKTVFLFSMFGFLGYITYFAILTGAEDILNDHTASTSK